jgi:hypothetical protein
MRLINLFVIIVALTIIMFTPIFSTEVGGTGGASCSATLKCGNGGQVSCTGTKKCVVHYNYVECDGVVASCAGGV